MWIYEKKLEYPVRVSQPDVRMAKYLITQFGGPDGELGAAVRYLSQRYTMPINQAKGTLTDIGSEEFGHWEMIGTMVYKLLKDASVDEIKKAGLGGYYAEHARGVYPQSAGDVPFSAAAFAVKGDAVADLTENMAAEEKARATYETLLQLTDDACLKDSIKFLREREVVHFQRFGECLRLVQEYNNSKKCFATS